MFCGLPLAWLWFVLINDLRVEWTVNPQYSYGWIVPFLCVFLLWRSATSTAESRKSDSGFRFQHFSLHHLPSSIFYLLFALLALLYLPTRLIEVANPDWRLVSWALALEVIGITLCVLRAACSSPAGAGEDVHRTGEGSLFQVSSLKFQFSDFIFPFLFFLVSVPWPTLIESPLIQALTRMDVGATCELAGWFGIPAIPHGNVIEVAGGQVGIDEACSGIRSFQATLMISLFLGEFYRLRIWRRAFCVGTGFALALLLNLIRQLVLVWVAATKGVPAIAQWHDPTGVIILLGCFMSLWLIGQWLAERKQGTTRPRTKG